MRKYWLYILKNETQFEGYTLALSLSPTERDADCGQLRTVKFKSWAELSGALATVGVGTELLHRTKTALDSEGWGWLREIRLSGEQLHTLGFGTT